MRTHETLGWRRSRPVVLLLLPPSAALVAVSFHLAGKLFRDQVDGVLEVRRALTGAKGHALEIEVCLGQLAIRDRGISLDPELDLQLRKVGDLLADPLE